MSKSALDLLDSISLDLEEDIEQEVNSLTTELLATTSIEDNSKEASQARIEQKKIDIVELAEGEIDPRLKLLSHSSRTNMHKCPRKYQLYRLASEQVALKEEKQGEQDVTFAYGHAVGVGVQSALEEKSEDRIYLDVFLAWDTDLLLETPRQKKSFWLAVFAVQRFLNMKSQGVFEDYELVYYEGEPAVELAFQINLPGGFTYRGFLDAALQHKETKAVLVLENKTSSGTANSTMFKNSGQALGYSVVLDKIFPKLSSYSVMYLVYETKTKDYVQFPFTKSLLQRALWLQELLIDCQVLELYESYEVYPMHGESCFDFFRDCEYLGICTLPTHHLTKPLTQKILDKMEKEEDKYVFKVDFYDLVEAQLEKGEE